MTTGKISIMAVFFIAVFSCCIYAGGYKFGYPSRGASSPDSVPLDAMRQIAVETAVSVWKQAVPAGEIPCCDLDGSGSFYYFIFRIDGGRPGDYSTITSEVIQGRADYIREVYSAAHNGKGYGAKFLDAKKRKWGIGKYGTVVVSGRLSMPPVPEIIHGLPPFYTQLDVMAAQCPPGDVIAKIYYITPMDQFYEFSSGAVFNGLSLRPEDVKDLRKRYHGRPASGANKKYFEKEWARYGR